VWLFVALLSLALVDATASEQLAQYSELYMRAVRGYSNHTLELDDSLTPGKLNYTIRVNKEWAGLLELSLKDASAITLGHITVEKPFRGQRIPWILLSILVKSHEFFTSNILGRRTGIYPRIDLRAVHMYDSDETESEKPPHTVYARKGFQLSKSEPTDTNDKFGVQPDQLMQWLKCFDYRYAFAGKPPAWESQKLEELRLAIVKNSVEWPELKMSCVTAPTEPASPTWIKEILQKLHEIDLGKRAPYAMKKWPRGKPQLGSKESRGSRA